MAQCTLCIKKKKCIHKRKAEEIGFEVQICKYYEERK